MTHDPTRRRFLRQAGTLGASLALPAALPLALPLTLPLALPRAARAASTEIRIVSNPGLENATLNALMDELGAFRTYGANARIVEVPGPTGPFDAIARGEADVCMVSGYNLVLSRIAGGAPVKIVGAGMRKCALSVFARPGGPSSLAALAGASVAVGPRLGLLHTLMLQVLTERGIDAAKVRFVDRGSNEQCFDAVVRGEADACCASISHLGDTSGLAVIEGGNLWEALPRCVFQTAYASDAALAGKHEGLVAVMAAYGALYAYLMSPASRDAFLDARRRAQPRFDAASADAIWRFNQTQRPYARDLALNADEIGYLQTMDIAAGSLARRQAFDAVADMSAAREAARRAVQKV